MDGQSIGADCFDELLEHVQDIRDIRASLTQFYQKNRDICTIAVDYDRLQSAHEKTLPGFFRILGNRLHWAITGRTTAKFVRECTIRSIQQIT